MIRAKLTALAARALIAWSFGAQQCAPLPFFAGTSARYRSRFPGTARPAGSKLARKAERGRLGVSTIR